MIINKKKRSCTKHLLDNFKERSCLFCSYLPGDQFSEKLCNAGLGAGIGLILSSITLILTFSIWPLSLALACAAVLVGLGIGFGLVAGRPINCDCDKVGPP